MARLIHLNGAPGVGKSTIAEQYVAGRFGVLNCDIDRLRCLVGGWQEDFDGVGALVRPVALAMIREHLDSGHDVVLPQMLANESERARFSRAALDAGHDYLHILLQVGAGEARERFDGRCLHHPLHAVVSRSVDEQGGGQVIDDLERRLARSAVTTGAVVVDASGEIAVTLQRVVAAVQDSTGPPDR